MAIAMDNGEMCDFGYLGRLPRPDGRGTFLYIGGIHAAGTSGCRPLPRREST